MEDICAECAKFYRGADMSSSDCQSCSSFKPKKERTKEQPLGVKFDTGKPPWALLPFDAVDEIVKVLGFGADKYSKDNWKHVDNFEDRYLSAALRHLSAHAQGETVDSESGLMHLAHAGCCVLFLVWGRLEGTRKALEFTPEQLTEAMNPKDELGRVEVYTPVGEILFRKEGRPVSMRSLQERAKHYPKIFEFLSTMPGVTDEERAQCLEDFATADPSEEGAFFEDHKDFDEFLIWREMPSGFGFWWQICRKVRAAQQKD